MADKVHRGPISIDWRYHRSGCSTCIKAESFLNDIKASTMVLEESKKKLYKSEKALELASRVEHIYASKHGKKRHFDLTQEKPVEDELFAFLLGPTGNLRAPILLVGKHLLVGFNEEDYRLVLSLN